MSTETSKATVEELPSKHKMGRFYILRRDNKPGGIFYLHEYDKESGRAPGYSLRTRDDEEAAALLYAKWIDDVRPPENQPDAPLIDVFNRYLNSVANTMASRKAACYALRFIECHFAGKTVKEMSATVQLEAIEKMRTELPPEPLKPTGKERKPLADSTILRIFGTIWAAINRAKNINWLPVVPPMVARSLWKPRIAGRKRLLVIIEVRQLFRTAYERGVREGEWSWLTGLIELVGTVARPTAARQVSGAQVDLPRRNLDLLVPGKHQEPKKFRPIIRMCETLTFWVERWIQQYGQAQFMQYKGQPVKSMKWFGALAKQASLPGITAYHFRHLMGTWLIEQRVSFAEKNEVMGQEQKEEAKAGHDYTHLSPDYQVNAAAAIERFFELIAEGLDFPLTAAQFRAADAMEEAIAALEDQPALESVPVLSGVWMLRREHFAASPPAIVREAPGVYRMRLTPQLLRSACEFSLHNQHTVESLSSLSGSGASNLSISYAPTPGQG